MPPKLVGLRIDIETKSRVDIKAGSYVYAEDPDFEVLCISYAPLRQFAGGAVRPAAPRQLDLYDQKAVDRFADLLADPGFQKHAFNANFERISLSRWLGLGDGEYIDPENWRCSAARANVNGVFGSLDEVAKAVRAPVTKDPEGRRLIRLFSSPDRKTGAFHQTAGRCWCGADHSADFAKFRAYCDNDVLTEAAVAAQLPETPADLQAEYEADQRVNDRGIRHHRKLSKAAVEQVATEKERLSGELKALTGLENPNSIKQMQGWLVEQGYEMVSLDKAHREEALADPAIPAVVAEALTLRGAASLSSVAKHQKALETRCRDGRIRGSLQFYGAHTGREAGRGIQPQNLPRYEAPLSDLRLLLAGQAGAEAPRIAKGSVRASLVPAKGHVFVVVDYNAIEARTLGWAAGEVWVNEEFTKGQGAIYEATADRMFGVAKQDILDGISKTSGCGKCGSCEWCLVREKGKVSNLALGYGGGAGALVTMGAAKAGIDIGNYTDLNAEWKASGAKVKFHEWERERHNYPELLRLRDLYRDASPATVRFWKLCARAWDLAALERQTVQFGANGRITMMRDGRHNRLVLPSGRSIWYRFARSHPDPNNPERIDYRSYIGKGTGVGHRRIETHGGKLTENINQALARDVLFDLIMKLEAMREQGWPGRLVLHVHDEVVIEAPAKHAEQVLADVEGLMSTPPDWAPGLAVKGVGDILTRYKK